MSKILVTGGPVHAYLDAVKIIQREEREIVTNRFKGGRVLELARQLAYIPGKPGEKRHQVTYLMSRQLPTVDPDIEKELTILYHNGIEDYQNIVLELAPRMDAIILGAAVANLIPKNPIKGKFPSHDYKPGDVISIEFVIAPRIIDEVKLVAPKAHVFGFKLLSGVSEDELVAAAYEIVLSSKATAVFANDATSLDDIKVITKERAMNRIPRRELPVWINSFLEDKYYRTEVQDPRVDLVEPSKAFGDLIQSFETLWKKTPEGYIFGTLAVRTSGSPCHSFLTTVRGKSELNLKDLVHVASVDHLNRIVYASGKATLNAPLLAHLFAVNPEVNAIVHVHRQDTALKTYPYAPPGTKRDSLRCVAEHKGFNIAGHGCFYLLKDIMHDTELRDAISIL